MKQILLLAICAVVFSCTQKKTEIYQWRGENRAGIFNEKNLLKQWPAEGPQEVWSVEGIGNGYGSPAVTENEIIITGEADSLAWIFCYDLKGELLWKTQYGREWARHYPGSRSAPTIAGDLVYTSSGMGDLVCLQRETGKIVWSRNLVSDFGAVFPMHGFSEAPVVDGNKIFCTPGGPEHNVVALDRFTGETAWTSKGMGERMGYNPGNIIHLPSRSIYVTFTAYHIMGIDTETGELLWTQLQDNTPVDKREPGMGDTHSNNIVYENGFIYYAAGDGNCGVKLQLSEDGSQISEVWRSPSFDSYMGGFVKLGDYLYGCGTRGKNMKSISAETGEVVDSLKKGTGAIIAADNMIFYYNWRGELSLLNYSDGRLEEKSSFKIIKGTKEHFSHPVVKDGILYQRHGDALMAYDIRDHQESKAGI